jgi:hypothetical protein
MSLTFWNPIRSLIAIINRHREKKKSASARAHSRKIKTDDARKRPHRHAAFFELP